MDYGAIGAKWAATAEADEARRREEEAARQRRADMEAAASFDEEYQAMAEDAAAHAIAAIRAFGEALPEEARHHYHECIRERLTPPITPGGG